MPLIDLSERWIHDSPMDRTVAEPEETPISALDVAAAAARKVSYSRALLDASPTVNLLRRVVGFPKEKEPDPVSGYDVLNDPQMKGREDYYNHVLWSESPQETRRLLAQIREQETDNRVLQQAGWGGVAASIGFIATDPLVLASMLVPVAPTIAGATRAQRVLAGVASQAAFDAAGEAALHAQQPLRTAGETAFNVGAGALLVGTLGAIVTRVPKSEFEAARKELAEAMNLRRTAASSADQVPATNYRSDGIPITVQRYEERGVALGSTAKPQGLYTSPAEIVSPHADLGGEKRVLHTNAQAKVLVADTLEMYQGPRGLSGESAGMAALRLLVGETETRKLIDLSKEELLALVSKEYPSIDWGKYFDNQEILEGYAGIKAREKGYDAIWAKDPVDADFNEYVGLTGRAFADAPSVNLSGESVVGAAATKAATTLDDETIATPAARVLAKTLGHISPVNRVMQSSSKAARVTIQRLTEVPYLLKKHLRGISSEDSIDTLVKRVVNSGRYEAVRQADEAFLEYRQGGGTLGRKQFMEFVSDAANLGDSSTIPQAAKVAQWARKVFNEDRETLRLLGVDIDDHVLGAKSYFPHVYDIPKIIADRTAAEAKLFTWFRANPKIPAGGDVTEEARKQVSALVAKRWELKQQDLADDAAPIVEIDKQLAEAREALAAKRGELQEGVPRAQANLAIAEKEAAEAKAALERELTALKTSREETRTADKEARKQGRMLRGLRQRTTGLASKLDTLNKQLDDLEAFPEVSYASRLAETESAFTAAEETLRLRRAEIKAAYEAAGSAAKEAARAARETVNQQIAALREETLALRAERRQLKQDQQPLEDIQRRLAENKQALDALVLERKQAVKTAVREARKPVTEAVAARKAARAEVGRLRSSKRVLQEAQTDVAKARSGLEARIAKLQQRLEKTKLSAAEMRPLAKEARKLASEVMKKAKAQKKVVKKTRKVKTKKAEIARKAVPPELEDAEVKAQVDATLDHILHMPTGRVFTPAGKPSPLKSRVLDIPYEIWKDYLVRDFETVMAGYYRSIAPEILLRQKFGSVDLKKEFDEIAEDFQRRANAAPSDKAKHELNKERDKVVTDTKHVLDRLLGHVGPTNEATYGHGSHWVRAARVLRTYAYVRSLGAQMLSSMADVGKLIARYGLTKTLATTADFLVNWNANKLTRAQNHRMGTAISMVVDTKSHQVGDIMDELPVTRLERGMQLTANTFSKLTLMSPWNSMIQHLSAIMEQDEILRAVRGGRMSQVQKATLVRYGITEADYPKLTEAFERWGEDLDGVFRARTDLWDPAYKDLALKLETAVLKAGDEILSARGAGDLPIFMDEEFYKTLLQFKTFAITSVNRTMIPVVQGLALKDARTAQGVLSMMTMGILIYYTKELAAGYKPSTDPERLIAEAFNWSGMMGYLPELWDPIAVSVNLTNKEGEDLLPRFSRFKSRSWMETMAGPTFGSTGRLTQSLIRSITNGDLEQQDLTSIKMMLPYRNWFPITRMVNAIEGEVGEQIGAEGATHREFLERLTELQPER